MIVREVRAFELQMTPSEYEDVINELAESMHRLQGVGKLSPQDDRRLQRLRDMIEELENPIPYRSEPHTGPSSPNRK